MHHQQPFDRDAGNGTARAGRAGGAARGEDDAEYDVKVLLLLGVASTGTRSDATPRSCSIVRGRELYEQWRWRVTSSRTRRLPL